MAGLLHDIGVLLLVKADADAMASFDPPAGNEEDLRQAELAHFGLTHDDAAAHIVHAWSLPEWLAQALSRHHRCADPVLHEGLGALPGILRLADHVATRADYGLWARCGVAPDAATLLALGLDETALAETAATLDEAVEALSLDA
jgi:HD-like signal output (HDOD) protein